MLVSWEEALLLTCMVSTVEASGNSCDKTGRYGGTGCLPGILKSNKKGCLD